MCRIVLATCILVVASQWTVAEQKQPPEPFVFGYTDKLSYLPAEQIAFHISSSASSVRIVIGRQGGTNETVFDEPEVAGSS